LDLKSFTSGDELQNYHSANLNFLNEQIISAPQNKFYPILADEAGFEFI
jgi:hypothetical protein